MKQKLLSILALLCLTVTSAWADGSWTSGSCTVTLTGGTLTVSGTGAMADYGWSNQPEWLASHTNENPSPITQITIESGVTHIGNYAFYWCNNANLTSVSIPSSVVTIGESAFCACTYLTSVTIGSGVTTIGYSAFNGCSGLTTIEIPANVTSIGNSAFNNCPALTTVTFAAGSLLTTIGNSAFYSCSNLSSINIPDHVTSIGGSAFQNTKFSSIDIPASVTNIETHAFYACSYLEAINVNADNTVYASEDGVLFNKAKTTLIKYPQAKSGSSYSIPATVTSIEIAAFMDCTNLTTVTIPASVTNIDNNVFFGCSNLATVNFNSNPNIGSNVFYGIANGATVSMNLTGNQGATGEYWMTFYNQNYNFQVPATGTQIFKAALDGSALTLTELTTDKIITKNNAVILKSTSGPIALTLTTTDSENDFSENSLSGVSSASGLSGNGSIYVLNYKAATGAGFYKLATGKKVGVGKAYLTYSGGAGAREFFGFEEPTGIDATLNDNGEIINDNCYDLQGRRVTNPTKGIYIVNGKKVFINK